MEPKDKTLKDISKTEIIEDGLSVLETTVSEDTLSLASGKKDK